MYIKSKYINCILLEKSDMVVCTTILYEYINLLDDIYNLFTNTHVRIKIYREFYHGIIYIDNEVRRVRIHI